MIRRPLPSTGSSWVEFPGFLGTTKTLSHPAFLLAALRFLRLAVPLRARSFAPHRVKRVVMGPGLLAFAGRPALVGSGDDRTSQVPGEPLCMRATFFDPGGTSAPGDSSVSVLVPLRKLRHLPQ